MRLVAISAACGGAVVGACGGPASVASPGTPPAAPPETEAVVTVDDPRGAADEAATLEPDEQGAVYVDRTDQLLKAIGSDRTVHIAPGTYDLGDVDGLAGEHVSWSEVHDGRELVIHDVQNLTLRGASGRPTILARPRYAFVVRLVGVENVTLKNLVLGHTPAGGCTGGVVGMEDATNVQIADSKLFGSGTVGVSLKNVEQFRFIGSEIRECTYAIASIEGSSDVLFSDSTLAENGGYDMVEVSGTPSVRFDNCRFARNHSKKAGGYVFFRTDERSSLNIESSTFVDNDFDQLTNDAARLRITGSGSANQWAKQKLLAPSPEYNQIYALARYQKWIVAGTQAGIVFWNPSTGQVDKLVKAYISSNLMVRGKSLWAGTYRNVQRFDGLTAKAYLNGTGARGGRLIAGPSGQLLVHQEKLVQAPHHWWRYQPAADRFVPLPSGPRKTPQQLGGASVAIFYGALVRNNGEVWVVDFLRSLVQHKNGRNRVVPRKSQAYPGGDPRALYEDPTGTLWAIDFETGFLRYDDLKGVFKPVSAITEKGSDLAMDVARKRTWLLHYTRGLLLREAGKSTRFFDLSRLEYMRALLLDNDGSVWVGGWNALVHLQRQGAKGWREQSYVVNAASLAPGVTP